MFTQDKSKQALFPWKSSMLSWMDVFKEQIQKIYVQVEAHILYIIFYIYTLLYEHA